MYVIFLSTLLCRKITSSGRAHYSSGSFIVWSMKGKIFESLVCLCESFDYYSQYFIFLNVHCTLNTYFIAAEFCLLHLLELRHPTMFSQHFLECLFCFNSYQDHKGALQILGIFFVKYNYLEMTVSFQHLTNSRRRKQKRNCFV